MAKREKEPALIALSGLPGTDGDVEAVEVSSVSAAINALRRGQAITAAGSTGALNVHKDLSGRYRCEFMRRRQTVDEKTFKFLGAVFEWLKVWFPKMREE